MTIDDQTLVRLVLAHGEDFDKIPEQYIGPVRRIIFAALAAEREACARVLDLPTDNVRFNARQELDDERQLVLQEMARLGENAALMIRARGGQ